MSGISGITELNGSYQGTNLFDAQYDPSIQNVSLLFRCNAIPQKPSLTINVSSDGQRILYEAKLFEKGKIIAHAGRAYDTNERLNGEITVVLYKNTDTLLIQGSADTFVNVHCKYIYLYTEHWDLESFVDSAGNRVNFMGGVIGTGMVHTPNAMDPRYVTDIDGNILRKLEPMSGEPFNDHPYDNQTLGIDQFGIEGFGNQPPEMFANGDHPSCKVDLFSWKTLLAILVFILILYVVIIMTTRCTESNLVVVRLPKEAVIAAQ